MSWRRFGLLSVGLVFAGAIGLGILLAITPPVNNAKAIVRADAQVHGIAYPGPVPPPRFVDALVATEDQRFFSPLDPGVDAIAIVRVVFGRLAGFPDQGGSTIDQQLAKMLYSPGQHGVLVEARRMAIALKLNFTYSHADILRMYAELAYYGHGSYGLAAASCGYFGKVPDQLNWAQAAMLAGVVNAPSADNPITHPATARQRESHVFDRLVATGTLSRNEADAILSRPLGLIERDSGACTQAD